MTLEEIEKNCKIFEESNDSWDAGYVVEQCKVRELIAVAKAAKIALDVRLNGFGCTTEQERSDWMDVSPELRAVNNALEELEKE